MPWGVRPRFGSTALVIFSSFASFRFNGVSDVFGKNYGEVPKLRRNSTNFGELWRFLANFGKNFVKNFGEVIFRTLPSMAKFVFAPYATITKFGEFDIWAPGVNFVQRVECPLGTQLPFRLNALGDFCTQRVRRNFNVCGSALGGTVLVPILDPPPAMAPQVAPGKK